MEQQLKNDLKREGKIILKGVIVIFSLMFLFSFISAETLPSYPDQYVNKEFSFVQRNTEASFITLSALITPSETIILNENMTKLSDGTFIYNLTLTEEGRHDLIGFSDASVKDFAVYIQAKKRFGSGIFQVDLNKNVSIIVFIILFVIAIGCILLKWPTIASILFLINGFIMLFNELIIFGVVTILLGVIIAFFKGGSE